MLYAILNKFGVPKNSNQNHTEMYSKYTIHLQVGKEKRNIEYGTGVQQGDNMAPVLFLFIMQAAFETLKKRHTYEPLKFRYFPNNTKKPQNQNGCFIALDTSSNGKPLFVNSWQVLTSYHT